MTPARKAALQWFFLNSARHTSPGRPGPVMCRMMKNDGEIVWTESGYVLTDLGRRRLHGDDV